MNNSVEKINNINEQDKSAILFNVVSNCETITVDEKIVEEKKKVTTTDFISFERGNKRLTEKKNMIYFFKDNNSAWYTAYEWSAYLMQNYNGRDVKLQLIKNVINGDTEYIKCSMKLDSFKKYINEKYVPMVNESVVVVHLSDIDLINVNTDIELNKLKNNIQLSGKNTKNKNKNDLVKQVLEKTPADLISYIQQIITYPVANKTFIETVKFVVEIQEQLKNCLQQLNKAII